MTTVEDQIESLRQTRAEYQRKMEDARHVADLLPHYEQCLRRLDAGIEALTFQPCEAKPMQFREVPR